MAGFKYVGSETGGEINGKVKTFAVPSSNGVKLGPGDSIVITGTGLANGIGTIAQGPTTTASTGVITAVLPQFANEALSTTWVPASTETYVEVNVDSYGLYEVDVANGPLVVADIGLNVPLVNTEGTVTGSIWISNNMVNATGKATTATLPYRVIRLLEDDNGVLGNRALVRVNASTSNIGATGI